MGRVKKLKKLLRHKEVLENAPNGAPDTREQADAESSEVQDGQKKKTAKAALAANFKGDSACIRDQYSAGLGIVPGGGRAFLDTPVGVLKLTARPKKRICFREKNRTTQQEAPEGAPKGFGEETEEKR